MGRKAAEQKLTGHLNIGKGVDGQRKSSSAASRAAGQQVGEDWDKTEIDAEQTRIRIEISKWKFLTMKRPWSRDKIEEYLNEWCNEHNLLSTQAQLPAFFGLCAAAGAVDRWQRLLDSCDSKTKYEIVNMAEDRVIKAWRECQLAIQKLDLKEALKDGEIEREAERLDEENEDI